jgi:hypothetical protein
VGVGGDVPDGSLNHLFWKESDKEERRGDWWIQKPQGQNPVRVVSSSKWIIPDKHCFRFVCIVCSHSSSIIPFHLIFFSIIAGNPVLYQTLSHIGHISCREQKDIFLGHPHFCSQ